MKQLTHTSYYLVFDIRLKLQNVCYIGTGEKGAHGPRQRCPRIRFPAQGVGADGAVAISNFERNSPAMARAGELNRQVV